MTSSHALAMLAATASRCAASSLHQHQKLTHTERGNSWGLCAPIPAVVYDYTQACELGRGVDPRSFSRLSHWLGISSLTSHRRLALTSLAVSRRNSPVRAVTGCASPFIQYDLTGCNRPVVHSRPRQHFSQAIADVVHFPIALSKSGSSAGFKTSWKDLTFEAEPLSSDDKIHD